MNPLLLPGPKKLKLLLISGAVLLAGLLLGGSSPTLAAEPYLRVSKGGVTYYFFSHRHEGSPRQTAGPGRTQASRPQAQRLSARQLEPLIREAAGSHALPPALIKAVIRVESNFNPGATSPKGAQGLMQLMPRTADELQVFDPYDVRENVWAGTRYLGILLRKFNYSLPLALAAYNAGPQRVEQWRDVPPLRETQDFVRDVCINFLELAAREP